MASATRERRPTWELTDMLIPYQGEWTVEEYLKLDTNRLIEYTDGFLEFLPMPESAAMPGLRIDVAACFAAASRAAANDEPLSSPD